MTFALNFVGIFSIPSLHNVRESNTNRSSKKSRKIHEKTPVLEPPFNKATGLRRPHFNELRLSETEL